MIDIIQKEVGMCECGCGQRTRIADKTDRAKGWIRGNPLRFIFGHSTRVSGPAQTARSIGNRQITSHGYVRVHVAKGVRQYEHIVVAERALGRPLRKFGAGHAETEVVHHIDGDKQNNAPTNLLICTHRYHTELHHRLEQSSSWPEFPPILRNVGAKHE